MVKEYSLSGVKYWKSTFSDLKVNDVISAKEFKERSLELNKLLKEDSTYSSFKYFKYGSKYELNLLEKFKGNLRYINLPYRMINKYLTNWDTSITYGVSWEKTRAILENNSIKETSDPYDRSSGVTKLTNRAMLDTFKKFGLARPLVNTKENPFWDEKFTHRMKFTSYIKSDVPYFIDEDVNILKGKGFYTEKNTILNIEILDSEYRYLVEGEIVGVCKL